MVSKTSFQELTESLETGTHIVLLVHEWAMGLLTLSHLAIFAYIICCYLLASTDSDICSVKDLEADLEAKEEREYLLNQQKK